MLGISKLLLVVAIVTAICSVISRFAAGVLPRTIAASTWLDVTTLLLLFGILTALLGVAALMEKKQA